MPDFPLPSDSHYSILKPVHISQPNFEKANPKWTSHFFSNKKMISLTTGTLLSATKPLISLQEMVKVIIITSLSFYIQLFHYGEDSKHTVLYAPANGALLNSPHQFALINARVRRIGKLAAQHS